MKLDKLPPITPSDPLANNKPKKWANVRRKFALIVANRNSAPPPAAEEPSAMAQAESFCRPYIQDPPAPGMPAPEPDREFEFARLTKENSARNKEITSPSYSAPKTPGTTAAAGRTKKKKKSASKTVRFIEEPFIIQDNEDRASIESIEAEAEAEEEEEEEEEAEEEEEEQEEQEQQEEVEAPRAVAAVPEHVVGVKQSQQRANSGLGGLATIRVVRQ